MVRGLTRIRKKRKDAEAEAREIRANFRKRGIKSRRIVVKPVGRKTLKKLLTKEAFKKEKKKKRFGVFSFKRR